MAYGSFAYWYDALNVRADYDRLAAEVAARLRRYGVAGGIVADLGCGTGELCLRLAAMGYEMLAADASADMLRAYPTIVKSGKIGTVMKNDREASLQVMDGIGRILGSGKRIYPGT